MSTSKRYERDQKSISEKQQVRFGANSEVIQPKSAEITQFTTVNCNQPVMCPFCLYQAKLSSFFISTKKGISQAKAECPECHNGMLMKSLWMNMSAKEYGKWVWDYRKSGFWQKCPFATWKKRLHDIGWSYDFWNVYRGLKGLEKAEGMFSDAERMARDYGINMEENR